MNILNCLLLDTANVDDIRKFLKTGMFGGVTTNPSLMAKEEKGSYLSKILQIAQVVAESPVDNPHLSVELISETPESMIAEAHVLNEISFLRNNVDLHLKVPVSLETMPVINAVSRFAKVNATACMMPTQAIMAVASGADLVSFFYNRIRDEKEDPQGVLCEFRSLDKETKVICGSIRHHRDILQSLMCGADYVTISPKIAEQALFHPQTDLAIKQFQKDIKKWQE